VLDVARLLFATFAAIAGVRARYAVGVGVAIVCAALVVIEIHFALRYPLLPIPVHAILGSVFLGPSSLPHVPPLPLTRVLMHPLHHVFAAALSFMGARGAFARSAPLPPEGRASNLLDRAGLRLVALGVVHGLMSVSGVLMELVGGEV
jgi:hypothetical protein